MNGTVLVLDDDAGVLELTSYYLKTRGFSTISCNSARCALDRAREVGGAIGVLIADVTLPDSSGVEAAVQLKKIVPDLKILLISGYAFDELSGPDSALYHLLPPSCVRFLRKPFSAKDLIARILELTSEPPVHAPPEVVYEALERQAGLLDMVYDAIIARTVRGEIRYWNRGAETLYGWTKDQAIGKSIGDLLHTEFSEPFDSIIERLRNTGCWEGELRHRTSTGSTVTVSSRWGLRHKGAHADVGEMEILEINRDITPQKRVEDELRRSEHRFRTIWESAPDAMLIVDQEGSVVLLNAQAERLFGYAREELIGRSVGTLLPEAELPLSGKGFRALRKNGEVFRAEVAVSPIEDAERKLFITTIRERSVGQG